MDLVVVEELFSKGPASFSAQDFEALESVGLFLNAATPYFAHHAEHGVFAAEPLKVFARFVGQLEHDVIDLSPDQSFLTYSVSVDQLAHVFEKFKEAQLWTSVAQSQPEDVEQVFQKISGVYEQSEGLYQVGIPVPAGRLTHRQLLRLADVSERHGQGILYLTPEQNVILPGIEQEVLPNALESLANVELKPGRQILKTYAVVRRSDLIQARADRAFLLGLIEALNARVLLEMRIDMACVDEAEALNASADVALYRRPLDARKEPVFVTDVYVASASDALPILSGLSDEQVAASLETLFFQYKRQRQENETLRAFAQRVELEGLQAFFSDNASSVA